MIGSSNKESVAEIIKDETGNRRFIGLHFTETLFAEPFPFPLVDIWKSVDISKEIHEGAFEVLLKDHQKIQRHYQHVDEYLEELLQSCVCFKTMRSGSQIYFSDFYSGNSQMGIDTNFQDWAKDSGYKPIGKKNFNKLFHDVIINLHDDKFEYALIKKQHVVIKK